MASDPPPPAASESILDRFHAHSVLRLIGTTGGGEKNVLRLLADVRALTCVRLYAFCNDLCVRARAYAFESRLAHDSSRNTTKNNSFNGLMAGLSCRTNATSIPSSSPPPPQK